MRHQSLFVLPLLLLAAPPASAAPASAAGGSALALAALVGAHSPSLNAHQKQVLARMLDGNLNVAYPTTQKIVVKADKVSCRASNVDISARSCDLEFGSATRRLAGRAAHELYATLVESGVRSDGAAGSVFEILTALACTADPSVVKQRAGSGVDCTFDAGP
jgi:hypothetical protein